VIDTAPWRRLYPFVSRHVAVNGHRMHYVDEGSGDPLLMLHGNPTWSFFFRALIQGLAPSYRCLAPDHIGCGLSARPPEGAYGYRLADRVNDIEAFCDALGLNRRLTLVVHDWGGMIGAAFALRRIEAVGRLVVFNTAAFLKPAGKPLPLALRLIRRVPLLAAPAVLGLNLFALGAAWTAPARRLSPDVRRGLLAPTRGGSRRRLATLRFVQDIPTAPADPSYGLAQAVDRQLGRLSQKPMLICWGERDFVFDRDYLAEWRRRFPGAEVHRFPEAGHYLLEDAPRGVLEAVAGFLPRRRLPD
jgi:haloalkane dehalogenase